MSTVTSGPVNVRQRPAGPVIAQLGANVAVTELAIPTVDAALSGVVYTWQGVELGDHTLGWIANRFLSTYVPPAPAGASRLGLHVLQDGRNALQLFYSKLPTGHVFPSATLVNDAGIASWLANGRCKHVVFRYVTGNGAIDDPVITPDSSIADGHDWTARKITSWAGFGDLLQYPAAIRLEMLCEQPFNAGHVNWQIGSMQAIEQFGLHAAIGGYSVGTPEPADWQALTPALKYAMAHGHIVCLHAYTKIDAPPGQLSAVGDRPYYELRFPRLYEAVTADARPDLVISEFGTQSPDYQGIDALLSLEAAYRDAIAPYNYVLGFNRWTVGSFGGWGKSAIDSALTDPRTIALFGG